MQGRCTDAQASKRRSPRLARNLVRRQNAERRRHGLRPLRSSGDLRRAARRHVRSMVRRHFFGHVAQGRTVVDRVRSTGYGRGRFAAQENLYWYSRMQSSATVLGAWMGSAAHRANVLNASWRHFGVAAVMRSPFGGRGITVVGVYGRR
jgi:uncharacterized protein YkwD